jgi:hypothetical protein
MTNPTPLSPAAQAVLDAFGNSITTEQYATTGRIEIAIAAALRAAVDQLTFEDSLAGAVINPCELRDIAAELEALPDSQ